MILVDSSVWIGHFRSDSLELREALNQISVVTHPFVIGELACGNFKNRTRTLKDLGELPAADVVTHTEVMKFIEAGRLWGKDIGWVDAHLLASALVSNYTFWTLDQSLNTAALVAGIKLYRSSERFM